MRACCQADNGKCSQCGEPIDPSLKLRPCNAAAVARGEKPVKYAAPAEDRPSFKPKSPSKLRQVWTYAKAVKRWLAAGSPTRAPERIAGILEICKSCEHFAGNDARPQCRLCGCSINNLPEGLNNKIAMATESCPLDPPKWVAEAAAS